MCRVVIFGNSGSGKTSLARRLSGEMNWPHLDLDSIAWKEADPPVRAELAESVAGIEDFRANNSSWVIEGCYASLIAHAARHATDMVFLNIGTEACVENCRSRPWEPEKYPSEAAQNENLAMLIDWVKAYDTRDDEFSLREHRAIYEAFGGKKVEIKTNAEAKNMAPPSAVG